MDDDDDYDVLGLYDDGYDGQCIHGAPHFGEDCCECEDEAEADRLHRDSVEAQAFFDKHGRWPADRIGEEPIKTASTEESGSYTCMLQPCEHGHYAETCTWCAAGIPPFEGEY